MGYIHLGVLKSNNFMKKHLSCYIILFGLNNLIACNGQASKNPLIGSWEVVTRDYIFQKNPLKYTFTEPESNAYKGQKIVFKEDTLLAFTTFLSEMLTTPILWEQRKINVSDLDEEGNLKTLLKKKGTSFFEFTISEKKTTKDKYFENFKVLYFLDGTIGIINDFSLFYLKRSLPLDQKSILNTFLEQGIIKGNYSESISIPILKNKNFVFISYKPNKKGENYFHVELDSGTYAPNWLTIYKIKSDNSDSTLSRFFKINKEWVKIRIFIGGSNDPLNDEWEIRYKFIDKVASVKILKSTIWSTPNHPTKQYLLKGDEVEILETQDDWLKIRYYGSKTIEGWIKKTDVE
ncbi:hypothetical protein SAMN04515674_115149 [Pseudarcicella hirudinis]|uniref:SH3b domain-containing protein n=2 Tax=Pseudarcicella hirudinis TaxID=1079859 RepID=A0A1I5XTA8_9BACT|nr:hypothetical protein SAMN04515674_115149 [Pseudarcicella hirudinis]